MTTRRAFDRKTEGENEGQGAPPQTLVDPLAEQVTNVVFRTAFQVLDQAVTAQVDRQVVNHMNPKWAKVLEFINLRQGNMIVKEYALRFTQLLKYAPSIVADSRARISKFILGLSGLVVKECRWAMLFHNMEIARLLTHAQTIEEEKLKERSRQNKRFRNGDDFVGEPVCDAQVFPQVSGN
ncbi:uncharacterized protein LOC125833536 [Solanum verrucosum]|uniref:uncharacterized protein LOC125833536 n=1 Tax=Solanum verrucosum TaxID=315347 RepID=UPI0020D11619|nr:uncharacterized protein LOC125833536 [Solanum verrucosum]